MSLWFLRIRPWQLFSLLFGGPVLLQMGLVMGLVATASDGQPTLRQAAWAIAAYLVAAVLGVGGLAGWFRAIGLGLQPLLPAARPADTRWLRVASWGPLGYLAWLVVLAAGASYVQLQPFESPPLLVLPLILVPHLLAMASIFYCLYVAARTLRTAELGRPAGLADFLGEFFLLWFFPVGIWVLQPRLNRLTARLPAA